MKIDAKLLWKTKKKLIIGITAGVTAAAIGCGIWYQAGHSSRDPVYVFPFQYIGMTEYWGDSQESHGPVTTDKIQTVFLSDTQTVTEILVEAEQEVKKGDLLMTFDTTLSDLQLERKRLEVEKQKLQLEDAKDELRGINSMKPMVIPEVEDEPEDVDLGDLITERLYPYENDLKNRPLYDGTTAQKALIYWIKGETMISQDLFADMDAYAARIQELNKPEEPDEDDTPDGGDNTGGGDTGGDDTGGDNTGGDNTGGDNTDGGNTGGDNTGGDNTGGDNTGGDNTGGDNTGGDNTGGDNTGGDNTGGDNTGGDDTGGDDTGGDDTGGDDTEGDNTTTGGDDTTEGDDTTDKGENSEDGDGSKTESGEEQSQSNASAVTTPSLPDGSTFYVVIKISASDRTLGEKKVWQCLKVKKSGGSYSFQFADTVIPDYSMEYFLTEDAEEEDTEVDFGSGYTAAQIAQMRSDKQKEIKDLEFKIRMTEAEYKIMQREVSDGNIYAEHDGKVVSLLTEEEAKQTHQPVLKVSGGGGFYVEGFISELEKDRMKSGQEVTVNDWNTGMVYTGTVKSIGDFPTQDGYYNGSGNPNSSYYPFRVFVDESADLQAGSYVSIQYSSAESQAGIYLENPFLRTEKGKSYVLVLGKNGKLEQRWVTTGKSLWGNYTEIKDNLTAEDLIAFPYGKNVKPGVAAVEGDLSNLYS